MRWRTRAAGSRAASSATRPSRPRGPSPRVNSSRTSVRSGPQPVSSSAHAGNGAGPAERTEATRAPDAAMLEIIVAAPGRSAPGRNPSMLTSTNFSGAGAAPGATLEVPMVWAGLASIEPGRVIAAPARLADVAPTLVAAAGGSVRTFGGIDLFAPPRAAAAARRREGVHAPTGGDPLGLPAACEADVVARLAAPGRGDSVALAGWDSLASRCAGSVRVALERNVVLSRSGREAAGARGLKDIVAALPGDPRPALAYAEHLLLHDHGDMVAAALAGISPANPFAALARWREAIGFAQQQDFVAAEGAARRAAALASPTPSSLAAPGVLHALGMLRDSSARAPRDGALRLRYGRALGDFGLFAPAYQQFHAARALDPESPEPDYWLAVHLGRQGRPQHAVPTLERALERAPTYVPARLALAEALLQLGRRHEAREQLERLSTVGALEARMLYNLACLRATEGDTRGALDALERAVGAGYAEWPVLETDPDLASLRGEPRYRELVGRRGR